MQDLNDKINNGGATADGQLSADEWNQIPSEMQNVIESAGLTLSVGDLKQLVKSIAQYSTAGQFFTGGGIADAYTASVVAPAIAPPALIDGMKIRLIVPATNTGASTVNAFSFGVVDIKLSGGIIDPSAEDMTLSDEIELVYRTSPGTHWELTNPRITDLKREIILAYGNYTTGTYTLPNSHVWTDYKEIQVQQRVSATDVFSSSTYPREIISLAAFALRPDIDQADFAEVSRSSATQFAITRGGNDEIALIIGILK